MGRIFVFSRAGCKHCRALKALLQLKGVEYVEVRVDLHRSALAWMTDHAAAPTVPQLFVEDTYVGDNAACQELEAAGRLATIFTEAAEKVESSAMNRFRDMRSAPAETSSSVAASSGFLSMWKLATDVASNAEYCKGSRKMKGQGILSSVCDLTGKPRVDALESCHTMLEMGILVHEKLRLGFQPDETFYVFQADLARNAAICGELATTISTSGMARPPAVLAAALQRLQATLFDKWIHENGRHVDYKGISTSAEFREFRVLAAELQCVPLNSLSIATMTALFINLYNLLVVHATIANGPPRGPIQRWRWFSSAEYRIGAFRFTLDDMEHGILRANSWRKSMHSTFAPSDPRASLAVPVVDPRIHFALVCGAKSCPPIGSYREETLNQDLDLATTAFINSPANLLIKPWKHKVKLSKLFLWYQSDFGGSSTAALLWCFPYCHRDTQILLLSIWGCADLAPSLVEESVVSETCPTPATAHPSEAAEAPPQEAAASHAAKAVRQIVDILATRELKPVKVSYFSYDWSMNGV